MVKIECLACGKAIKPRQLNDTENYDTANYDGQVVCQECKALAGKISKREGTELQAHR